MKKTEIKIPSLILIAVISIVGFMFGVFTIALWQENWLVNQGILNREFIYQINNLKIDKRALFFLCFGKRLRAFFVLFLLTFSSVNRFSNLVFFGLNGFYVGSIMELFTVRYGMQGIIMYLSLVLPHGIFYVIGFVILGCWCLNMEKGGYSGVYKRKEKVKSIKKKGALIISLIMILFGAILESYVNNNFFLFFVS